MWHVADTDFKMRTRCVADAGYLPTSSCEDLVVLKSSNTCTNELASKDLCVRHVLDGDYDWQLIG